MEKCLTVSFAMPYAFYTSGMRSILMSDPIC